MALKEQDGLFSFEKCEISEENGGIMQENLTIMSISA